MWAAETPVDSSQNPPAIGTTHPDRLLIGSAFCNGQRCCRFPNQTPLTRSRHRRWTGATALSDRNVFQHRIPPRLTICRTKPLSQCVSWQRSIEYPITRTDKRGAPKSNNWHFLANILLLFPQTCEMDLNFVPLKHLSLPSQATRRFEKSRGGNFGMPEMHSAHYDHALD
jgi:hypothetical protein